MGCCCSTNTTPLLTPKSMVKIDDFIINDSSQNFYELGTYCM